MLNERLNMLQEKTNERCGDKTQKMYGFKDAAIDAATKSCNKYHKHGALLIRNGQIISSGHNDENRHAEHNAILAGYRLLCGFKERKGV